MSAVLEELNFGTALKNMERLAKLRLNLKPP